MKFIDGDPRVKIIEDDFHEGDSIYKLRSFYTDEELVKLVAVIRTGNYERNDFFYFQYHKPIFTGHMVNRKDEHLAAEYKFYYQNGEVVETLFWRDKYAPGKRFPHENFKSYSPNIDSLEHVEASRIKFYLSKLDEEGFVIRELNENLDANIMER